MIQALLLSVAFVSAILGIDDITEKIAAAQAAAQGGSVLLPPTVEALPEEVAWNMLLAEGGAVAGILAVAVVFLWRIVSKVFAESRTQNQELMKIQVEAIARLGDAVLKVESAVRMSDMNNQHAIGKLSDTVASTIARLDRQEQKLESHHDSILHHSSRLSILESRRTPASTPVVKGP